ncbi:alpha/beta fold hydrolase [Pelagicoccus albus]|uniref:Alpha/beta hydrolase n=1 Tax=Pelagicoccus albus TaxID=415222 RepID=A0A7X1B5S0_9BACT|nr:alpha/beta hydrolase [Pelagicoccus albus]MBC2605889.1 alpha/beta hydrolase [Pelagicoccus albus]
MKKWAKPAAAILLASAIGYISLAKKTEQPSSNSEEIQITTTGHGPSIVLLHDSSQSDLHWADAAKRLSSHFQVTLVDVTSFLQSSKPIRQLRTSLKNLNINDSRIAGSAHTEQLALHYALSFPEQSASFILPHTGEDLEILADLINSHPLNKS